jgi:hypothetical protein
MGNCQQFAGERRRVPALEEDTLEFQAEALDGLSARVASADGARSPNSATDATDGLTELVQGH